MASFVAYWLRWPSVELFLTNYTWAWPLCEIFHFVGLILLFGAVGTFDLRLLGLGKGIRPAILSRLIPWGVLGFGLCVATGFVFVTGIVAKRRDASVRSADHQSLAAAEADMYRARRLEPARVLRQPARRGSSKASDRSTGCRRSRASSGARRLALWTAVVYFWPLRSPGISEARRVRPEAGRYERAGESRTPRENRLTPDATRGIHGHDRRRHRRLAHADHRLCARPQQAATTRSWAPIFEGYEPVQQWLADKQPDVLFLIFNDHVTSFFFDHYSAFALGIGEQYAGRRRRRRRRATLPPDQGPSRARAAHRQSLVADEFDLSYLPGQGARPRLLLAAVDAAGRTSRLARRDRAAAGRRAAVPDSHRRGAATSSARRCARAIESYPEDLKVAIVATGGLSHQVHGERAGFNNTPWDHAVPRPAREATPKRLADMTHRGVRRARRLRRRRSHHVAHHARRAVGAACRSCTRATTCRR